jgi:hypothetical protein
MLGIAIGDPFGKLARIIGGQVSGKSSNSRYLPNSLAVRVLVEAIVETPADRCPRPPDAR